jgi:hypothetical protein
VINNVSARVAEQSDLFTLHYSADEIGKIVQSGGQLGLDQRTIEDFIFVGSRNKKIIGSDELIRQMDDFVNVVSKRGFPFRFDSATDFVNFQTDLKILLSKNGIPTNDIRIQGSSLGNLNAKDVDIVVFVDNSQFHDIAIQARKGLVDRVKPKNHNRIVGAFDRNVEQGRINSFYIDAPRNNTFNQQILELRKHTSQSEGLDLSIMLIGRDFDVSPYIKVK